tara:strand:- start:527 stop:1459 length:933 start_codon:yes stop_codon:yes gene_type:complete
MITAKKLDEIASIIASKILREDSGAKSEKERQDLISKQIADDDLDAPANSKEETITDEAEEDDEAEEEEDVEVEAKPKPDAEGEDEGGDDEFAVQAPEVIPAELSYSQIKKQINNLRAGKSLKDEEVSTELEDYFDELGPGEKSALFTYLASIGAILTGGTQGEDAPRPYNLGIDITAPEEDKDNKTPAGEPDPVVGPDGEEVAPIIVGELADKTREHAMVLENMSAGDSHRCMNGKIVDFGSSACVDDIGKRIDDATFQRDALGRGSADRSSMNGTLKYLRQKMRKAQKIQRQDTEEKLQGKLNLADSA